MASSRRARTSGRDRQDSTIRKPEIRAALDSAGSSFASAYGEEALAFLSTEEWRDRIFERVESACRRHLIQRSRGHEEGDALVPDISDAPPSSSRQPRPRLTKECPPGGEYELDVPPTGTMIYLRDFDPGNDLVVAIGAACRHILLMCCEFATERLYISARNVAKPLPINAYQLGINTAHMMLELYAKLHSDLNIYMQHNPSFEVKFSEEYGELLDQEFHRSIVPRLRTKTLAMLLPRTTTILGNKLDLNADVARTLLSHFKEGLAAACEPASSPVPEDQSDS